MRTSVWWTLWKKFETAEQSGSAFPVVSIAVTYSYRDGTRLLKTITLHGDLILKQDDNNIPDGYQEVTWSGACSFASGI